MNIEERVKRIGSIIIDDWEGDVTTKLMSYQQLLHQRYFNSKIIIYKYTHTEPIIANSWTEYPTRLLVPSPYVHNNRFIIDYEKNGNKLSYISYYTLFQEQSPNEEKIEVFIMDIEVKYDYEGVESLELTLCNKGFDKLCINIPNDCLLTFIK